jgi:hypothetical protein
MAKIKSPELLSSESLENKASIKALQTLKEQQAEYVSKWQLRAYDVRIKALKKRNEEIKRILELSDDKPEK